MANVIGDHRVEQKFEYIMSIQGEFWEET